MIANSYRLFCLVSSLAVLIIPSCNPKINDFTVVPDRTCGNDTSKVSYNVSGTGSLSKLRHGNGSPDTISYILTVERCGKKTSARHDVLHWSGSPEIDLAFESQRLGLDSLAGADTLGFDTWVEGTKVES